MNLADMLCYADIAELTAIAETYDCACSSHSKNELIQTILSTVQRRDVLEARVGEMTAADLRFLNSLLFEGRGSFSLEELKARALAGDSASGSSKGAEPAEAGTVASAPPASPAKRARSRKAAKNAPEPKPVTQDELARRAIVRFKKQGWLFNGFSQHTRYLYQVPEDVRAKLSDALERRYRTMLDVRAEPPAYRDEQTLLAADLRQLLRFVRDNDLQLTSEGVLYKRQIGQLLDLMSVVEALPARVAWRFGYGRHYRDYPDRLSLLYDYAFFHKLIEERTDRLVLTEAGRNAAEGTTPTEPHELYRFWLRLYKGPIPNVATLAQWIARLSTEWVTVESLYAILQPLVRAFYYDSSRDVFERRVMTMLMHAGVVRWGETAAGEGVVRATAQGRAMVVGQAARHEDKIDLAYRN